MYKRQPITFTDSGMLLIDSTSILNTWSVLTNTTDGTRDYVNTWRDRSTQVSFPLTPSSLSIVTSNDSEYGASVTFKFNEESGLGTFGINVDRTYGSGVQGGLKFSINKLGYFNVYRDNTGSSFIIQNQTGRFNIHAGQAASIIEDENTLKVGVLGYNRIVFYINDVRVYELANYTAIGNIVGLDYTPGVNVLIKNLKLYE